MLLEVPIRSNTDIGTIKRPIATNNWDVGRFHMVNIYKGCYRSHDLL